MDDVDSLLRSPGRADRLLGIMAARELRLRQPRIAADLRELATFPGDRLIATAAQRTLEQAAWI
jgi:hypothetical protein